MRNLQRFASVHASVSNNFSAVRDLTCGTKLKMNRDAALVEWCQLGAA
jgi:putative transposase